MPANAPTGGDLPATGSTVPVALIGFALAAVLAGLVLARRRRRS